MSSFPTRPTRDSFGPTLKNARPIRNPNQEIPDAAFNSLFWTVAGMAGLAALAKVRCSVPAGVLGLLAHAEVWNPNAALAGPTPVRVSAGIYTFAYAATYVDELGVAQTLAFTDGEVNMQGLGNSAHALVGFVTFDDPHTARVTIVRSDTFAAEDGPFTAKFF